MRCAFGHEGMTEAVGRARRAGELGGPEHVSAPACLAHLDMLMGRWVTTGHRGVRRVALDYAAKIEPVNVSDECLCARAKREYCHSTKCHGGADFMTREQRIAERTRDLLDEIVDPAGGWPDSGAVGEVADEIARYVLELDASGAARGLAGEVAKRLALRPRKCRQGSHRDGEVAATLRIAYVAPAVRGDGQRWTVDMCERHASIIRERMIREGKRSVRIVPGGWTPADDCTHGADCTIHPGTGQVHNLDQELPGMWESSDLHGGEADGYVRPAAPAYEWDKAEQADIQASED